MRFVVWFALGLIVYFAYGRKHSSLNAADGEGSSTTSATADGSDSLVAFES